MVRQSLSRFRTVRPAVAPVAAAPVTPRRSLITHPWPSREAPPVTLRAVPAPDGAATARVMRLAARGSPLGFHTVGALQPLQRAPAPPPTPIITPRGVLDETTRTRVASRRPPSKVVRYEQEPAPRTASSVGILASGGTMITMTPADLTVQGRTDITQFVVVHLDAGVY
jgi:hypothetical protein